MEIKLISFNIHKGIGWQTRKSTINLMHTQMIELKPDIILLQEVLGSQLSGLSSEAWPHCSYGKNALYKKGDQGNAIVSKFPLLQVENINLSMHRYEHRGLLHSTTTLPEQNTTLHLLCVHLGLFPADRRKQIDKIIRYIKSNIPVNEPLILGGDFNDWASYATRPLKEHLDLSEAFIELHGACARTYPAWSPIFKLDRIYYKGLHLKEAHRLIKKPWKNLSDHIAIDVTFEF